MNDAGTDIIPEPNSALLPPAARRWVWLTLAALLGSAVYLLAVRGTAILYDLGQGLAALCF